MKEPIAIIGMGCRFPGGVNSPETFWQLLVNGVDAITPMPPGRFDVDSYYDATPGQPGKIITREGGFLQDISHFDAAFFGISAYEAQHVDPQQRLLLEVTWDALEDASQNMDRLAGSRTGVFIGMWTNDYEDVMYAASNNVDLYVTTGGGRYSASGRLSYAFDFRGPSMTVDTACSSSLVTVLLACDSLWNRESDLAVAGGTNLIIQPEITIGYSRSGMLSPDGRCKFGDASANGYVRSEGVGVVILKRLSEALRDGDLIYATIRGGAVNNDGQGSGLLVAPSSDVQADMLRDAYRTAEVDPGQVGYIEAHGTGTRVGDPVEIRALAEVLSQNRPADRRCALGSVKTNIGHTEAASGVAGLIKVALCLQHQQIPASLHFHNPNPNIPWAESPFEMQRELGPWPETASPALAGVNSFGVTGTNAHIILQEAPAQEFSSVTDNRSYIIPISARAPEALRQQAQAYAEAAAKADLYDLAYTASVRRTHHEHRLAVVARSTDELVEKLRAFENSESQPGVFASPENPPAKRKTVFVFPGQGAQWLGMGRQLSEQEPVFRETLERCETAMQPYVDWSLLAQLFADEATSRLAEIDVVQPMLFAVQVALAALWQSWGVQPDAVIGHSMGEVAAAHVAGILSLDDAAHVICRRSQLMKQVSGRGTMAMVELSLEEAHAALAGYEDRLAVAVSNSPRSSVLSGDPAALAEVVEMLQRRDVFVRPVKVDVAAHSPHMDALRPELVRDLQAIQAVPVSTIVYSTVTGEALDGETFDADYWGRNLRELVRFSSAVERALADGYNTFIEISPHPVLLPAIERGLRDYGLDDETAAEVAALPSMKRDDDERGVMLDSLAGLYTRGYPVDWRCLYPAGGRPVRLPAYPWQREHYWAEAALVSQDGKRIWHDGHPLLGQHWQSAVHNGMHFWETDIEVPALPYLADHRVQGNIILPAAAFVEMVFAAAHEVFGAGELEQIRLHEALLLNENDRRTVQVVLSQASAETMKFRCLSRPSGDETGDWTLHAEGVVRPGGSELPETVSLETLLAQMPDVVTGAEHYKAAAHRGLQYGSAFQGVERLWLDSERRQALAQLSVIDEVRSAAGIYQIHPALLDAAFQLLVALLPVGGDTYLPVSFDQVVFYRQPDMSELWAYAVRSQELENYAVGDVLLFAATGEAVLAARGLRMQRVSNAAGDELSRLLYAVEWRERPLHGGVLPKPEQPGSWLILSDGQVGVELASRLRTMGETCFLIEANHTRPDFRAVLKDAVGEDYPPLRGVIDLWSAGPASKVRVNSLQEDERLGSVAAMHLAQALAEINWPQMPRLWLVTRGTQPADGVVNNIEQAPLWGFGAVLANEQAELHATRIDLSVEQKADEIDALFRELWLNDGEDQLALRGGKRYVPRLVRSGSSPTDVSSTDARQVTAAEQPYRVEISTPGILDNLSFRAIERRSPGVGEVEIEIRAAGLNFLDVMKVMGVYPGLDPDTSPVLGAECAGVVVAVGEGVRDFVPGDEVVAITPAFNRVSLFATHAVIPSALVARKPARLSFEEAATLPVTFLTAYYALYYLGRLAEGERVLIHSATGGVGLAAIQLARRVGAEVYATAGSQEKRDYLLNQGVAHVMDSRSLAFADEIMAVTGGQGVDVVLNSLAGEAIPASLSALAPYGRFLEIGKRDIYQNNVLGLEPFKKNLSFFAIDLARAVEERPSLIASMFAEVMQLADEDHIQPLPATVFPLVNVKEAVRQMAQAKHIGKIVLAVDDQPVMVTVDQERVTLVRPDATYLITGGLGGLGLTVASGLVDQGARHLVLIGRRGASETAQAAIRDFQLAGAEVIIAQADVADYEAMAGIIRTIESTLPPLQGVIHAAGILDDSLINQMDEDQFRRVTAPKVRGAWNLHMLTQEKPLDFFVLFSSATALLGTPGQANYAAANAFMDGLAHYRQARQLPALSINWGPWSEVGLAAAQANRGDRLASRGLGSLSSEQGLQAFMRLLTQHSAQVSVMDFDAAQWMQTYPAAAHTSLLAEFAQEQIQAAEASLQTGQKSDDLRQALLAAEPGRPRRSLLENHIRKQVAQVLGIAASRISLQQPLRDLGIDSLLTLELRNRLESTLKLTLSATLIFNYPTVTALTNHLAEKMNVPLDAGLETPSDETPVEQNGEMPELEQMSRDEIEALLAEELKSIDDLLKGS